MGSGPRVSIPALLDGGPGPPQDCAGGVRDNHDCPVVAAEGLVCPAPPSHGGRSHPAATGGTAVTRPRRFTIPGPGEAPPGRLATLRGSLQAAGISEAAAATMEAALRPSTKALSDGKWRVFCGWCALGGIDPLPATVSQILDFSQYQRSNGLEFNTIGTYATAPGLPPFRRALAHGRASLLALTP